MSNTDSAARRHSARGAPPCTVCAAMIIVLGACGAPPPAKRSMNELVSEALTASRVLHPDPSEVAILEQRGGEQFLATPASPRRPDDLQAASQDGPRVSDTFIETDVRQALQSLAVQAGVSIILDEQVRGAVSAQIDDQPFEIAVRQILLPLGLVYRRIGAEYYIGVPDPASALFPYIAERYEYATRHMSPTDLIALLPPRLRPFMRFSDKRNLVIIEAPQVVAERILWEMRHADTASPQVILEAIVVVFAPEHSFQFGFDFEQGVKVSGQDAINAGMAGLALHGMVGPGQLEGLKDFTFTSALLRAMAREGYINIRAAPRVMAKDGERATITIGRQTFFSVQPDSNVLLVRQDLETVEAGITLDIRPVIRGDTVTVTIDRAEVSEDIRSATILRAEPSDRFPVINRRTVSTTVSVKDGETIVIGGLVQKTAIDRTAKIPVLGDVPGLGLLFQQIDKQSEEAEVAIFISPRIVHASR